MGKITKRLVWILLPFVLGLGGSLIAAWFQIEVLQNLFTPRRLAIIGLITLAVLILLAWKDLRDEAARPDDKRDLTREQRNREVMLGKVRSFWVTGVLEQSLHGAALIELRKEYKPEAVHYPWTSVLQRRDQPDKTLPSETKTIEVFNAVGGELLILGEPGSGKTTMLLDLARDLIARAEHDAKLLIPVVFNLSSWAEKCPPLADWLAEELNFRYDVPKKIATAWVKDDSVLPLLDGLDEVKLEHRAACVEAINEFRKEHGLLPTVVCSRIKEYEDLNAQLRLQGAIVLQPLATNEIDLYLASVGDPLQTLRALLHHDQPLQELAVSPLMLNIMVLAYSGLPITELATLDTLEKRRKHLFDTYVQRMFERRGSDKRYTRQQVIHWLSWLARRLVEHDQTTFYLERMQPSWLQSERWRYRIAVMLLLGLFGGLAFVLLDWLGIGTAPGDFELVSVALFLVILPLGWLSRREEIKAVETLRWSSSGAKRGLFGWLSIGLAIGLVIGLLIEPVGGSLGALGGNAKKVAAVLPHQALLNLILGLGTGLFFGLLVGLVFGLAGGLFRGLGVGDEIKTKIIPNQGIWRSAQNAALVGLPSGLVGGMIFGLVLGLVSMMVNGLIQLFTGLDLPGIGLTVELFNGLVVFGLFSGLASALLYGGLACLQHTTLRLLLWRGGAIPLNYVRFLDYCAERIFLRKVGGGYIFVHRLLMEYFAGLGD